MMLRAGLTDVALAIGVEKMHSDDKLKSSAIFDGGWDVHDLDAIAERLTAIGDGVSPPPGTPAGVRSTFMELYASVTRGHMRMFDTPQEPTAAVASKIHWHSQMTPFQIGRAQRRDRSVPIG